MLSSVKKRSVNLVTIVALNVGIDIHQVWGLFREVSFPESSNSALNYEIEK